MTNRGNTTSGPQDLDRPFQKRRRNLGRKNADGITRADAVALVLAQANNLRELAAIAVRLGTPQPYVDKILGRPYRNSVKVMLLHQAARHFYEKARARAEAERRERMATRRTTGHTARPGVTGRTKADTPYGPPPTSPLRRRS